MNKTELSYYEEFLSALRKSCTRKEIAPKEKHIRRILINTHKDRSGMYFFVAFFDLAKIEDPMVRFKCLTVLYIVLTDGSYCAKTLKYAEKCLSKVSKSVYHDQIYTELIMLLYKLIDSKIQFIKKVKFLKCNFHMLDENAVVPFSNPDSGLQFVNEILDIYDEMRLFIEHIFDLAKNRGVDSSLVPENQIKLRVTIPVMKDMDSIIQLVLKCIRQFASKSFSIQLSNALKLFNVTLEKHKHSWRYASAFTYITDQFRLPQIPNTNDITIPKPEHIITFAEPSINYGQAPAPPSNETSPKSLTSVEEYDTKVNTDLESLFFNPMNTLTQPSISPINSGDESNRREERINDLEKKIDELSLTKDSTKNDEVVREIHKKLDEVTEDNRKMRNKLDNMKTRADERDLYYSKFENLSKMYTDLRGEFDKLCNSSKGKEQEHTLALRNQGLIEELAITNTKLVENENKIKELNINNLQLQSSYEKLNERIKNINLDTIRLKICEESIKLLNTLTTNICISDLSRDILVKTIQLSKEEIELLNFELMDITDDLNCISLLVIRTNSQILNTFISGKRYMLQNFDMNFDEKLNKLRDLQLNIIETIRNNDYKSDEIISKLTTILNELIILAQNLPQNSLSKIDSENFNFESEADIVLKNIEFANRKVNEIKTSIIADESIYNHESKILDECGLLFSLLNKLIEDSKLLQTEIIGSDKSITNEKTFYKKNSAWADGLVGFTKGMSEPLRNLVNSIQGFINGEVYVEELTVAFNNLIALVTQFVIVSRTKADYMSKNLAAVKNDVDNIRQVANNSVMYAKQSIVEKIEEKVNYNELSKPRKIALENEIQIKILELETKLEKERKKFYEIRKSEYK